MNKPKKYGGLDYFRIIAAVMVVAIHTSPLSIFGERADVIFTRIICRVAVPFFFMVSGYFLYEDHSKMKEKVHRSAIKTAKLYIIAILLYLPINIYNGYLSSKPLLTNIIKDVLFNGSFYHLWYLPAAIIGVYLTLVLFSTRNDKLALLLAFGLYTIGLLGDSYYGIIANLDPIKELYDIMFRFSDYSRNGIFYAPVFLVLGGLISRHRKEYSLHILVSGFIISISVMILEGIMLSSIKFQRHDSMYIMLLPSMFFLFNIILHYNWKERPMLRKITTVIYIIHPFVIILVRGMAKLLNLQELLINNSIVHFIVVLMISIIASLICVILLSIPIYKPLTTNKPIMGERSRAWVEIDLAALEHNVEMLNDIIPEGCDIMAIVKANAYGHGDQQIASRLNKIGINSFGVATIDEGISLRKYGSKGDILILGYTDPNRSNELHKYQLIQTVIDYDYAKALNRSNKLVQVHLKIDTGMHRIGLRANEINKIVDLFSFKMLDIQGAFTHLSVADSLSKEDIIYTKNQMSVFDELIYTLKENRFPLAKVHFQSSYGLLNYPDISGDYVRVGIALYGVLSSAKDKTVANVDLHPVLALKTRVAMVQKIGKGEQVGYDRSFVATRNSLIAVLTIGYADGLPRNLSCEKGGVLLHSQYAPVVGLISMDQTLVDVTDIPAVKAGDIATLIGKDGNKEITAAEIAYNSGTITNEILSRLGTRLERIYI